ncbi:hypothetical protein EFB08_19360 [Rufibacter latericius]|uniref:Uncharacterized protein n=2 Tax=Rufibacter latericius TaxID=2487040 RepID=A0A3M9MFN3_9BACT|nr:hypothetical protein EFB08_19360 [Rufibacter latericius]
MIFHLKVRLALIWFLILGSAFSACEHQQESQSPAAVQESVAAVTSTSKVVPKDSTSLLAEGAVQDSTAQTGPSLASTPLDCVRGTPEPIVRKKVFPNTHFVLLPDSLTGIETIALPNGDKVIIRNHGCEYFTLTFRFETSEYRPNKTDPKSCYQATIKLMEEVLKGIEPPIGLAEGVTAMKRYISSRQAISLEKELSYGSKEEYSMDEAVILEKVEPLSQDKVAIEVRFSLGPL